MTGRLVDTNVILRYMTNEPPEQAERAAKLFEAIANGNEHVLLEEVVCAEVIWTLSSYYRMPRRSIADVLLGLLAEGNIGALDKEAMRVALAIFSERNLDFADAILAAKALQSDDSVIYSFDRDFDRISGVIRREPNLVN